jgi:diadenosine tetraphosphate (Ap4A) HIT family hydrolase
MTRTIVHERVDLSNKGENPKAIIKMKSGWVVFGDNQTIPGYCLLLSDPVSETINDLDIEKRKQFLIDMTIVGDALLRVLNPRIINYSILENTDHALHAHIHPRYEWEEYENKKNPPFIYNFKNEANVKFDLKRDEEIMKKIKKAINEIQTENESY